MSARKRRMQASPMRCQQCQSVQYIYRFMARLRPKGHMKGLWCARCEKKTVHDELPPE